MATETRPQTLPLNGERGSVCFWLFSAHPEYIENKKQPEANGTGIFGWPSNYITMGATFEYLLDFWKPPASAAVADSP